MKKRVCIKRFNKPIFTGRVEDIKIKENTIINRSVEVFGDDNPCIIHRKYCMTDILADFMELFKENKIIYCEDCAEALHFLDYGELKGISIEVIN